MSENTQNKIEYFKQFKFYLLLAYISGVLTQINNTISVGFTLFEFVTYPIGEVFLIFIIPTIIWGVRLLIGGKDSKKVNLYFKIPFYIIWSIQILVSLIAIVSNLIK